MSNPEDRHWDPFEVLFTITRIREEDSYLAEIIQACCLPESFDAGMIGVLRNARLDDQRNRQILRRMIERLDFVQQIDGGTYCFYRDVRAILLKEFLTEPYRDKYELYSSRLEAYLRQTNRPKEQILHMIEQVSQVSSYRAAIAPYNFVPLPSNIVPAPVPPEAVRHDIDDPALLTGAITCTLTTETPLYVRCGLTAEQVREELEAKDQPDFFYLDPATKQPVIPGSTLRGLLRALVEIAGYGKVEHVTDRRRFFFRAVAAKVDDPLANPYRAQLRNVRAGYLVRHGDGWAIRPATIFGKEGYLKAREKDVPPALGLIRFNERGYRPQYIPVSFTTKTTPKGRLVIDRIDRPGRYQYAGVMVTSGNMLETVSERPGHSSDKQERRLRPVTIFSPRKNHAVVGEAQANARPIPIDLQAIEDYCASLTDFQRGEGIPDWPFHEQIGIFAYKDGTPAVERPIFYCEPAPGQMITLFGQSPNFRVPYRFPGSTRAASPHDFVPEALRDRDDTDLADAIFGYVLPERDRDLPARRPQALAGRLFVGDARPVAPEQVRWLADDPIVPRILATPKPTTFQHYLVQTDESKPRLKHYGSRPETETTIRGHKLYWHKGTVTQSDVEDQKFLELSEAEQARDTQHTRIRPLDAGNTLRFTIRFENLHEIELGALLWVLRLSDDTRHDGRQYRLKLGMGKPLGLGAVRIASEVMVRRRVGVQRYHRLFDDDAMAWELGEEPLTTERQDACVAGFEAYVLEHSGDTSSNGGLTGTLRIQMLLALLSWPGPLPAERFSRYMEIERVAEPRIGRDKNEYKDRPVLPTPRQVLAEALGEPLPEAPAPTTAPAPNPPPVAPTRPAKAAPALPAVGAVFRSQVLDVDETAVVVEIPGFAPEQAIGLIKAEHLGSKRYKAGNAARVTVLAVRTARSGRVIVELKPAI